MPQFSQPSTFSTALRFLLALLATDAIVASLPFAPPLLVRGALFSLPLPVVTRRSRAAASSCGGGPISPERGTKGEAVDGPEAEGVGNDVRA